MDEELKVKLQQAHQDETDDILKYEGMIDMAKDSHIKGVLCDILKDEKSHKKIIEVVLNGDE